MVSDNGQGICDTPILGGFFFFFFFYHYKKSVMIEISLSGQNTSIERVSLSCAPSPVMHNIASMSCAYPHLVATQCRASLSRHMTLCHNMEDFMSWNSLS